MHALKKLWRDGITRRGANDRIDRTLRTDRSLLIVYPFNNIGRLKYRAAIEASANAAPIQFASMQPAVFMRGSEIFFHSCSLIYLKS